MVGESDLVKKTQKPSNFFIQCYKTCFHYSAAYGAKPLQKER